MIVMMTYACIWTQFFAPESPQFLYAKDKFEELNEAFTMIQKFNGNYDQALVEAVVSKLKN
jgi:hypothetical protein